MKKFAYWPLGLLCVLLVTTATTWSTTLFAQANVSPGSPPPSEQERLAEYLENHRLYDLLALHLRDELRSGADAQKRLQTARELADLYAWQLNTTPARFEELSDQLDQLTREFPEAIPLSTQTNIAFGRYRNAKILFESWIWDRQNRTLRDEVDGRFASIIQRATDAAAALESQIATAGPSSEQNDPDLALLARRRLETGLSQFRYLAGWARYYRSLTLDEGPGRDTLLSAAERDFLDLLDMSDREAILSVTPQWFSLNTEWTCRLLLGLGMTSQAMEYSRQADFCFSLLTESRVPADFRDNARVWKFHSLLFPGQIENANAMVGLWESNRQSENDIPFWSAVAIGGLSWSDSSANEASNMTRAGLCGLAKSNEFTIINELLERYPGRAIRANDFFSCWMSGYLLLRNSGDSEPVEPAAAKLLQALELATGSIDPIHRARCRYHYGFALYQALRYGDAVEQFRQSSTMLKDLDPVMAEHASWMKCQTLNRLAAQDTAWRNSLVFALDQFQRDYASSANASEAAFIQIMNQLDLGSLDQAIATLKEIDGDDPNFETARFEICRISHRRWSQVDESEKHDRQQRAAETVDAARQYLLAVMDSGKPGTGPRQVRVCLLAADVVLNQTDSEPEKVREWLARCLEIMPDIDSERELGSDYHSLSMAAAARSGRKVQELADSQWLLRNAFKKSQLRAALVSQARVLDAQLSSSFRIPGEVRPDYDQVVDAWRRLVDEFDGDDASPDEIAIARSALLRLAELEIGAGDVQSAHASYKKLYYAKPDELVYLMGLARCEMLLKRFEVAARLWRMIAAATPAGGDSWLESKYNLILCLQDGQPEKAAGVLSQVQLLVPDLPEHWLPRFDELDSQFSKQ